MQSSFVETLVGAFVITVAVAFLVFAYTTAEVDAAGGYTVTAKFDRVDGLTTGADVRMSGIKVGTVSDMRLDNTLFMAVVDMNIRPDVQIPADSSVRVAAEGLLGGNYLVIEPGGDIENLNGGSEIKYTQGSIDLMNLVSQFIFSPDNSEQQ